MFLDGRCVAAQLVKVMVKMLKCQNDLLVVALLQVIRFASCKDQNVP